MKKDERLNFSDRTPSVRRLVVSLVLMLLAALPAAAQNKKITVDLDNVPVREFIKTVESQSGYTFAYNNSEIDLTRRVSVKAADENVVDVVIRALSAQNLTARMEGSPHRRQPQTGRRTRTDGATRKGGGSDRNGQNDFGRTRHRRQRNRLGDQPGQRHRS